MMAEGWCQGEDRRTSPCPLACLSLARPLREPIRTIIRQDGRVGLSQQPTRLLLALREQLDATHGCAAVLDQPLILHSHQRDVGEATGAEVITKEAGDPLHDDPFAPVRPALALQEAEHRSDS